MKVESIRHAHLSDYEVLQFMSYLQRKHRWNDDYDVTTKGKKNGYNHPELQKITRDVVNYLTTNKNSDPEDPENKTVIKSGITRLNDQKFTILMNKLNEFELFKVEKLQIVNHLTTNMAVLYSIVEECELRFTEQQINEILETVQSVTL